ncbi:hypothetical protein, partial [Arcobacter sp.]
VTSVNSVFNDPLITANNTEFSGIDKNKGDNRALGKEEIALNYMQDAKDLKEALAETSNMSKESIDNIFLTTQKGMVNFFDKSLIDLQLNTVYKDKKDDIQFVIDEAKQYFTEASKGQVYLDRNTMQLVPMMDINNYRNSLYTPSSNSKIVKDTLVSLGLTGAGLVSAPEVSIPAWVIDTYRNYNSNGLDPQNTIVPAGLGNPLSPRILQQAGAGLSIINTVQSIDNYEDKIKQLEQQRDSQNNQELQNIYNNKNNVKIIDIQSTNNVTKMKFIKVNP